MSLHVCEYICQDYPFFAVGGTTCWCGKIMTLPQVAISSVITSAVAILVKSVAVWTDQVGTLKKSKATRIYTLSVQVQVF